MLQPAGDQRARRAAYGAVAALVLFRSGVFTLWPQAHFDADSAITGLMAKHLAEGRAFPLFYYGQSYMLGVDAWLAAPLFLAAGPSVTALKLPLVAMHVTAALLLVRTFMADAGLRPALAVAAALPFLLPMPGTAARIVEANGGNAAPFFYTLLLWTLRHRPVWAGLVFGIGFLHREFTLYGLLALFVIEAADRATPLRTRARQWGALVAAAAAVWLAVQALKPLSSAAGPGTSPADIVHARNNLTELAGRVCLDLPAAMAGVPKLVTEHWPVVFGTQRLTLVDFGIESRLSQGLDFIWILPALLAATAMAAILRALAARGWRREYGACAFFVLVGVFSAAGYVLGRCGEVGFYWMRYDLLALLGASGLAAWFLAASAPATLRRAWLVGFCVWIAVAGVTHARLWHEYLTAPPVGGKQLIIRELDARGIRYAYADYWYAYAITFLTNERIVVGSDAFTRIRLYLRIVNEHRDEAIRISREPCAGGEEVLRRIWVCR